MPMVGGGDARDARYDRISRDDLEASSVRHVYALASDRPLRLTDRAFDNDGLRALLGSRAYRAADPYETIIALSRRFVPAGPDEDWGEDLYTMDVTRPSVTVHIAKIYCPGGSVIYVRDEIADRASCPSRGNGHGMGPASAPVPRPDSVVASNGRPVQRPIEPGTSPRIFRVPKPADAQDDDQRNGGGGSAAGGHPTDADGGRDANGESVKGDGKAKGRQGDGHQHDGNHDDQDKANGSSGNSGNSGNNPAAGSDQRRNRQSPEAKGEAKPNSEPPAAKPRERETKSDSTAQESPSRRDFTPRARPDSSSDTPHRKEKADPSTS